MKDNLIGIVLCGGNSTRMGSDKGMKGKEGKTWAQIAESKLSNLNLKTFISINKHQKSQYSQFFKEDQLIVDALDIPGPFNGVLTIHKTFPKNDLLIIACDLVEMSEMILQKLKKEYSKNSEKYNFFGFASNDFVEPLIAIYSRDILSDYLLKSNNNTLLNFSLQSIIKSSNPSILEIENYEIKFFKNFNSIKDL